MRVLWYNVVKDLGLWIKWKGCLDISEYPCVVFSNLIEQCEAKIFYQHDGTLVCVRFRSILYTEDRGEVEDRRDTTGMNVVWGIR